MVSVEKKGRRRSNFKTPKHLNILFAISIQTWLAVPHTAIECNINVKLKFPYKHKSHWMWYKRRRLRYNTYTFVACTSETWMRMGMGMRVCVCAHALCFILPDWSWISMRHCTFTLFWSKKKLFRACTVFGIVWTDYEITFDRYFDDAFYCTLKWRKKYLYSLNLSKVEKCNLFISFLVQSWI